MVLCNNLLSALFTVLRKTALRVCFFKVAIYFLILVDLKRGMIEVGDLIPT